MQVLRAFIHQPSSNMMKLRTEKLRNLSQMTLLVSTREDSNLGLLNFKAYDFYVIALPKYNVFLKHEWNLFLPFRRLSVSSSTWLRQHDCLFLSTSCSHKYFHAHCILISLDDDHFSNLPNIFMFSCLCSSCFLNLKCIFHLFFFSKILTTVQNLAQICVVVVFSCETFPNMPRMNCFFFTPIAQCLLHRVFILSCSIEDFPMYLTANTWKVGITPYLYYAPLKKIEVIN